MCEPIGSGVARNNYSARTETLVSKLISSITNTPALFYVIRRDVQQFCSVRRMRDGLGLRI